MKTFQITKKPALFLLLLLWSFGLAHSQNRLADVADIDANGWVRMKPNTHVSPLNFFALYGKDLGLGADDEMRKYKETEDKVKQKHYHFEQLHKGISVENALMTIHCKNGNVEALNGNIITDIHQDTTPIQSEGEALQFAMRYIGKKQYVWENSNDTVIANAHTRMPELPTTAPKGDLVLALKQNSEKFKNNNLTLAYRFSIYFFEENYVVNGYMVYVDAKTGGIVKSYALGHNCYPQNACTGQPRYANVTVQTDEKGVAVWLPDGTFHWEPHCVWIPPFLWWSGYWQGCYEPNFAWFWLWHYWDLDDNCQGDEINTLNQWLSPVTNGGGGWSCTSKRYTTAHWAAKETYNYFLSEHGRTGFANTGSSNLVVRLQPGWNNAMALPLPLNTGMLNVGYNNTGTFATLDVIGHEYTHLVTDNSVGNIGLGLIYEGESGALNESFSDIFGTMTEFHSLGSMGNYYQGEDYDYNSAPGTHTRDLSYPNSSYSGQPDTYGGTNWSNPNCGIPIPAPLPGANDMCGVHTNSGVQNFWFYLLAEGGSGINDKGDSYCVQAIGRNKAAAIAYYNLTVCLASLPLANYNDSRIGSINAAIALYGPNSFEVAQVISAWYAVGVGGNYAAYSPYIAFNNKDFSGYNYWTGANDFRLHDSILFGNDVYAFGTNYGYYTDLYFSSEKAIDFMPNGFMNFEDAGLFEIGPATCPTGTNGARLANPPATTIPDKPKPRNIPKEIGEAENGKSPPPLPKDAKGNLLKSDDDSENAPPIHWEGKPQIIYEIRDSKGKTLQKSEPFEDFEAGKNYIEEIVTALPKGDYTLVYYLGDTTKEQVFTK